MIYRFISHGLYHCSTVNLLMERYRVIGQSGKLPKELLNPMRD